MKNRTSDIWMIEKKGKARGLEQYIRFWPHPGFRVWIPFQRTWMVRWSSHKGWSKVKVR